MTQENTEGTIPADPKSRIIAILVASGESLLDDEGIDLKVSAEIADEILEALRAPVEKPENPFAFPMLPSWSPEGIQWSYGEFGMTLRDYVAASVLQGLMANPERYKYIAERMAAGWLSQEGATEKNVSKAFKIADAFLAERAKGGQA